MADSVGGSPFERHPQQLSHTQPWEVPAAMHPRTASPAAAPGLNVPGQQRHQEVPFCASPWPLFAKRDVEDQRALVGQAPAGGKSTMY